MKCDEIIKVLQKQSAEFYAAPWDNVGLQIGRKDKKVKKIYIALDATGPVIQQAIACGADMLLTHHPMIFGGITKIVSEDFLGKRIIKLIQNDIAYYAMHTNFDVIGMADLAADYIELKETSVLEITYEKNGNVEGFGRLGVLGEHMTLESCCHYIKDKFELEQVKVFGDLDQTIKRIAIAPGSGKSFIEAAIKGRADVLITGDINHHEGIDANERGLAIVDAGHYGLEKIFVPYMANYLKKALLDVTIEVEEVKYPFQNI